MLGKQKVPGNSRRNIFHMESNVQDYSLRSWKVAASLNKQDWIARPKVRTTASECYGSLFLDRFLPHQAAERYTRLFSAQGLSLAVGLIHFKEMLEFEATFHLLYVWGFICTIQIRLAADNQWVTPSTGGGGVCQYKQWLTEYMVGRGEDAPSNPRGNFDVLHFLRKLSLLSHSCRVMRASSGPLNNLIPGLSIWNNWTCSKIMGLITVVCA